MTINERATAEESPTEEPSATGKSQSRRNRKKWPFVLAGLVVGAAILVVGGTALYINVISDDAPAELSLSQDAAAAQGAPAGDPAADSVAGQASDIEGTWVVTEESVAGYRVDEILFGQHKTVVGRTSEVTGEMTITGTKVEAASFTVDMASVTTDSDGRDGQYRSRIMDVATHPTSTFVLTEPIDFAPVPEEATSRSYTATGELTLRGTTKLVTMELETQRVGDQIEVVGQLPVVFADFGIPSPSIPGISVEDNGVMEFSLKLDKAP